MGERETGQTTIGQQMERAGISRRTLLDFCARLMVAAPAGLALTDCFAPEAVAREIEIAPRPSVIWLHFQDCTGCSETLLRTSQPDLAELLLHLVSVDYHETLMAAAGHQAEAALHDAMQQNRGRYVLVVEGSIPRKHGGVYMKLAGKPAIDVLQETAQGAAAIIAIGSCASWGGIPSTPPNPTDAVGVDEIVTDVPIVNVPGCPPNPYTFLGVVLEYATAGTLPALDDKKRPLFAYDRVIHDHCPRRAHFDAGEFAREFGDEAHKQGWCLYHLGCKGPITHAGCSTRHFNEVVGAWPIGIGAPCVGCTEEAVAFKQPMFDLSPIHDATPPSTYPPIEEDRGEIDPLATGLVGLATGAILGGAWMASRRFSTRADDPGVEEDEGAAPTDGGDEEGGTR